MPSIETPIERWRGPPFSGAKLAALNNGHILTYRRDNIPGIPFPGCIDIPGGGRESDESPTLCALRELHEEFGLTIPPARIIYTKTYGRSHNTPLASHFLALALTDDDIAAIRFGSEGSDPSLMPLARFLAHEAAIPHLQQRLAECLDTLKITVL